MQEGHGRHGTKDRQIQMPLGQDDTFVFCGG